jgi:excisionase family DNA binding protein
MNTIVGAFEPIVCSVDDAMRSSNLGRTFIYQLINDGSITSIKRGKRRLIVYASLKAFLTAQSTEDKEPSCTIA